MVRQLLAYIRLQDWWNSIIPPIAGFYFLGLQLVSVSSTTLYQAILLLKLLFLSSLVAAFGFFLNDWTDIKSDLSAGKANAAARLSRIARWIIFLLISSLILILVLLFNFSLLIRGLVMSQVFLLLIYSTPPIRLKRFPYAAVTLDALYSGTIFFVIAVSIHGSAVDLLLISAITLFGILKGVRNIFFHLQKDKSFDSLSGQVTIAHLFTVKRIESWQSLIWLFEIVLFAGIVGCAKSVTIGLIAFGIFLVLIKFQFYKSSFNISEWLAELNSLYEVWFPIAAFLGIFSGSDFLIAISGLLALMFLFPACKKIFSEVYIGFYNVYYLFYRIYFFFSDLYFLQVKPRYDIMKMIRSFFGSAGKD